MPQIHHRRTLGTEAFWPVSVEGPMESCRMGVRSIKI